jgi:hypothetical protein
MRQDISSKAAFVLVGAVAFSGTATIGQVRADELPVVAIHNEIGVAAEGQLLNYKENFSNVPAHDRENGWAPGANLSGQVMFNAYGITHIYAAIDYGIVSGQSTYTGATIDGDYPVQYQHHVAMRDLNLELGKGFALLDGRLLLTPVLQFGHHAWDRDLSYSETYHNFYVGGAVHVDYALTQRLVLSGRFGVAETFKAGMDLSGTSYFANDGTPVPLSNASFNLGALPVWQAGVGLDYAITKRCHLFGKLDFQRFGYSMGTATLTGNYNGRSVRLSTIEPNSWTQTLMPMFGAAYAF